jgi:hypothetical protein
LTSTYVHATSASCSEYTIAALIYHPIAVTVFIIADLVLVVIRWFGAVAFVVAFSIFAHSMRLIEVITWAALVDCTVTVIVFTIATDLFLRCNLPLTCSPTTICLTGAYSRLTFSYVQSAAHTRVTNFFYSQSTKLFTAFIYLLIAIVILAIAADLFLRRDLTFAWPPFVVLLTHAHSCFALSHV